MHNNNFIEKISIIVNNYLDLDKKIDIYVDIEKTKTDPKSIKILVRKFPFLGNDYIGFIKIYNGIRLSWCDFLSINGSFIPTLYEYLGYLKEWDHNFGFFPFAKDASGSMFAFSKDKKGVWFFNVDSIFEPPEYVASSFEEFVNDCVLGERYPEFMSTNDDHFYEYLRQQGWA